MLRAEARRTRLALGVGIVKPTTYGSWLIRLLLDTPASSAAPLALPALPVFADWDGPAWLDWDILLDVARANAVLVRTAERLAALGVSGPEWFVAAVASERQRIRAALELMDHVSRACKDRGIPFLFPKAFQDYPDFGDDIDLLVLPRSTRVDDGIIAGLPATAVSRDLGERISGATTYLIGGYVCPLDVQHGRLGLVGEHDAFPQVLAHNARSVLVEGVEFAVPRPEDQLVLQGMQRVPGRLRVGLCDMVFTIATARRASLDWDYVVATARQHGALPGLSCYLSYADQIHRDVFQQPLLSDAVRRSLVLHGWGRIEFHDGRYRFPSIRANGRLYWWQLRQRIATGDWSGAGRLCLIPVVAGDRAGRRLARRADATVRPPTGREWPEPLSTSGVRD